MRRRWYPDEMERPAPVQPVEELPLFAGAPQWPEVRPAEAEPHVLPIDGTIAGRYAAWRSTEDGQRAFEAFTADALGELARGATRLSAKASWERMRATLRIPLNNDHHAPMVREAEDRYPDLRGLFEKRQRKAS